MQLARCDDRADASDANRLPQNFHSVVEQPHVASGHAVNVQNKMQILWPPAIVGIFNAEDVLAPAEEPLALFVREVFDHAYIFAHLLSLKIRSINFASSGSKPTLERRGVSVAQFLSIAKTLRK